MRLDQRRLTLLAMAAVTLLMAMLFLAAIAGLATNIPLLYSDRPLHHQAAFGIAALILVVLDYLYWRGHDGAARIAVLLLPLVMPLVFPAYAFEGTVPQGIWIPFILALAICRLNWAILTLVVTVVVVVLAYPNAFQTTFTIGASLIIAVLLIAGRLVQLDLWRNAVEAQRRAEESMAALQESEAKYRMLAEQLPLAVLVLAPDGRTLRANRAWETIWGIPFAATHAYNLLQDRQLEELGVLALIRRAFAGECVQIPVHEYDKAKTTEVASSGGKHWIRAFAYPLQDAAGKLMEVVLIQEDVTDRMLADEQIRNLANFDPLTQLPNRRQLMEQLRQALIASQRNHEFGALLILDLDQFKTLNDSQGHDVGDLLLIEVAHRLSAVVRRNDLVARVGGDEYAVILEGLGKVEEMAVNQAEDIAETIRLALNVPYTLPGVQTHYHFTSSLGLTLFVGQASTPEILLKQADLALYQAKDAGRNGIRFFNPTMQATIDIRMAMEAAMRSGLAAQEFHLHYQPQVDQAGSIIGVEALLRWQSPSHGPVSPSQFIPLAEHTGLILPLGKWVLDTACRQLRAWADDPDTGDLQMSVNASPRQFLQADFVAQVQDSLAASGANPVKLTLELTENVVLDNIEAMIGKMQQLDDLGVSFALDDFGTGYSSLSYLKRLPIRQVKIDQSFVRDIHHDPNDAAIVRAILAMSQSLNVQVIAEGVETREQHEFLVRNGCLAYQGYLFGRPMPIEELQARLHTA